MITTAALNLPEPLLICRQRRKHSGVVACLILLLAAPISSANTQGFGALYDLPIPQLNKLQEQGDLYAELILLDLLAESQGGSAEGYDFPSRLTTLPADSDAMLFAQHIRCYLMVRQPDKSAAIDFCRTLQRQLSADHEPILHVLVADTLAFVLRVVGRLPEAMDDLALARAALPQVPSDYLAARVANTEAFILLWSGLNDQAVARLQDAQSLASKFADRPKARALVLNLGLAYFEAAMYSQALEAFQSAAEWGALYDNDAYIIKAGLHTARTLVRQGKASAALAKIEALSQDYGAAPIGQPLEMVAEVRGHANNLLEQPEVALQAIEPAMDRLAQAGNMHRWGILAPIKIESLYLLGNTAAAAEFADQVVATEGVARNVLDEALIWAAQIATQQGAHEQAAQIYARALQIREQQFGGEFTQRISVLQSAAELERSRWQAQLDMQQQSSELERARLRTWILGILVISLVLLTGILFLEYKRRVGQLLTSRLRDTLAERTDALEAQVDETKLLQSRVVEDDKMRALGQLTGGIAHDYNNLLMVIQGCIELMALDERDLEGVRKLRETISESVETGRDLNNLLLSYARRRQLAPVNIELRSRLQNLRPMLEKVLGPEMELAIDVPEGLVVQADLAQMTTAIINLLSNARRASAERGRIEIFAGVTDADLIAVAVRDFGHGMTEEQRRRAPEPFYSSKQSQVASGLGLSMVEGFVHQSGGRLQIDSALDVGTTVYMHLPCGTEESTDLESNRSSAPLLLPPGLRCCLVDDDPLVRASLAGLLEKAGFECTVFGDAETALAHMLENPPDILISDVLMPGTLGGEALADQVRAAIPQVAVILVSGYVGDSEVSYPLLSKPFDYETLTAKVHNVWQAQQQQAASVSAASGGH